MDNLIDKNLGALKDELEAIAAGFVQAAPEDVKEMFFESFQAMAESDILDLALKKGDIAPDFCLPDANGEMVSSVDLCSRGPLVVVFFRGNWCSFCNATLRMIRKYSPHLKARNATIVAISPLSVEETAKAVKENGLNFPVLSDTNSEYSQLLNIAFVLDEKLKSFIPDLKAFNNDDSYILPIPATYVIETDSRVTYSFLETNYTKRAEPVDILNALPPLKSSRRMSLDEKMQFEIARIRDRHPHQSLKTMYAEIERLKNADVTASALREGSRAPDFKLYSKEGYLLDSKRLRRHGPLIVTFYHGLESPLCMLALESLQKFLPRFEAKGATIVAISPGSISSGAITPFTAAKFPLLIDTDNQVAEKFGISNSMMNYLGRDNKKRMLPLTATFVIDRSGKIAYSFVNADHTKRAEPRTVLKTIPVEQPKFSFKRGPFSFLTGTRLAPRRKVMQTNY
jgi:peroxiredoxin